MSGFPYPPPPAPGSNAIGSFQIGTSPIGTVPPFDYLATIISQYANSPALMAMIEAFNDAVDQTENIDNFFDMIWDIDTAQGYGLDVWGRIVGVVRTLQVSNDSFLGFDQASPTVFPFGSGIFFSGTSSTSNFSLSDSAFRTLILAKALANICDGSIPAINNLLLSLFPGRGDCFVTDGEDMTMTYTFNFTLTPVETAIVVQSGVLPKPVGVSASVVIA